MKNVAQFLKTNCFSVLALSALVAVPGLALAEPTLTIPAIGTTYVFDAADSVFTVIAIVVAIVIGIRLFKKA